MFGEITDVRLISVVSGSCSSKKVVSARPSHALLYRLEGESVYCFDDRQLHVTGGSVLYIPENARYSFYKCTSGADRFCLVNFHATMDPPISAQVFYPPVGDAVLSVLQRLERKQHLQQVADRYESLSLFYKLLALLSEAQSDAYVPRQQKQKIESAVAFLQQHLFSSTLKIGDLPQLCGMSAPTFRRIFTARFGATPKRYIIQKRMLQAKAILESGEYRSIAEVAKAVGYDDALYFSKHFKDFFHISPSDVT